MADQFASFELRISTVPLPMKKKMIEDAFFSDFSVAVVKKYGHLASYKRREQLMRLMAWGPEIEMVKVFCSMRDYFDLEFFIEDVINKKNERAIEIMLVILQPDENLLTGESDIIEDYKENPQRTLTELRKKYGIITNAEIFAITIFLCDDLLKIE